MKEGDLLKSAWGWLYKVKTVEVMTNGKEMIKLVRIHDDGREQLDVWTDNLCLYSSA